MRGQMAQKEDTLWTISKPTGLYGYDRLVCCRIRSKILTNRYLCDSKQVSIRIVWYRSVSFGIGGGDGNGLPKVDILLCTFRHSGLTYDKVKKPKPLSFLIKPYHLDGGTDELFFDGLPISGDQIRVWMALVKSG